MRAFRFVFLVLTALSISACVQDSSDDAIELPDPSMLENVEAEPVSFIPVKNYYLKNKTSNDKPIHYFVLSTQAEFDKEMGPARVARSLITKVDFSKEMVLLIVIPASTMEQKIVIDEVMQHGRHLDIHFHVNQLKERVFAAVPMMAVKVPKGDTLDVYFYRDDEPTSERVSVGRRAPGSPLSETDVKNRFMGTFKGVLPCADCPGIETKLTLKKDQTYTLTETYQDRDASALRTEGRWTVSDDLAVFVLENRDETQAPQSWFIVNKNTLEKMDLQGKRIKSELNYQIVR